MKERKYQKEEMRRRTLLNQRNIQREEKKYFKYWMIYF